MKNFMKGVLGLAALIVLTACNGKTTSDSSDSGSKNNSVTTCTFVQVGTLFSDRATVNIKCSDADGIRNTDDFSAEVTVNGNMYRLAFADNVTSFDENVTVKGLVRDTNTMASLDLYVVDGENGEIDIFSVEGILETNSVPPPANTAPTANAGEDKSVTVNNPVTIKGSGTDPDGTVVSYEWKEGSTVLATTASFDYTPTTEGAHTLTLTVEDDEGATDTDLMTVTADDSGGNDNAP